MRKAGILLLVLATAVTGLGVGSPLLATGLCDGTPYLVGNQPASLFAVTTDPAAFLDLGDLMFDGEPIALNAVGIRSTDGLLYGWDDTHQQLVTVDADLTVSPLPSPTPPLPVGFREPDYIAGEISPDGDSYYLFTLLEPETLFVVDLTMSPVSLTLSTVALSERVMLSDFAFHPADGLLYGELDGELWKIDPQTGEVTRSVLGGEPPTFLGSAWVDPSGTLFGVENDNGSGQSELWAIDLETLDATSLGTGAAFDATDGAICDGDCDGDGVPDGDDLCHGTVTPETVPTVRLGVNRFALTDDSGVFSTRSPRGRGPRRSYTIEDTAGCSCEQIIFVLELGQGHRKHGCSISAMDEWVASVALLP